MRDLYRRFDFRTFASGELDELFMRYAAPGFKAVPPDTYPDVSELEGLKA